MENQGKNSEKQSCPSNPSSTETDAWPFGSKKDKEPIPPRIFPSEAIQKPQVSSAKDDLYYNMDNPRRGVALIFNHVNFDKMSKRHGSEYDRDRIENVLKYLHFETRVYNDLSYFEVLDTLDAVALEDHTDADCLVVVVMTHGNEGVLYAKDHQYPVDLLWNKLSGDKCPTMAGKPKLIFIQACRGEEVDDGVKLRSRGDQTDSASFKFEGYTVPANADILVMYSTFKGHTSFRIPTSGSWFIQALCRELQSNAATYSLLDILTFTTRRVAIDCVSCMTNPRTDNKKQIPSIVSHLTRIVHFGNSYKILK